MENAVWRAEVEYAATAREGQDRARALGVPVAAQSVVRIYGTQSNGTITEILITTAGRLVLWGS